MNVVISGPFGRGSLADEAVLAGLLKHLKQPKNTLYVLSANPHATKDMHGVEAIKLTEPGSLLSAAGAWEVLEKSHLFVLAGAGVISSSGTVPARTWLGQLENAQTAGLKTAVVGIGAEKIGEARDRARVQRLLHHCAEGITARDESSKKALISYGLNANRVSTNGDPTLGLIGAGDLARPETGERRIGIVLAQSVPSRTEFSFVATKNEVATNFAEKFVAALLKGGAKQIRLFHDDTDEAGEFADELEKIDDAKIESIAADRPIAELQKDLAECNAVFSFSLQGLMLAVASGTPAAGLALETGAAEFLNAADLKDGVLDASDPNEAAAAVLAIADKSELREKLKARLIILKRKEMQNARMMELLVPRRVERDRMDIGERISKHKYSKHRPKNDDM
jgi:polysaccharide pyruvyl transferase WcaK-like protein